jgi:hypothetical protein
LDIVGVQGEVPLKSRFLGSQAGFLDQKVSPKNDLKYCKKGVKNMVKKWRVPMDLDTYY